MVLSSFFSQVQPSELGKQGLSLSGCYSPFSLAPQHSPAPHRLHSAVPTDLCVQVLLAFDLLPLLLDVASAHPLYYV